MDADLANELLLSIQRALLGALTPNLYGACVAVSQRPHPVEYNEFEHVLELTWYVAPELTEDELEDLTIAGTEVLADFPHLDIDDRFVDVADRSAPLPTVGQWAVLQRGFRVSAD